MGLADRVFDRLSRIRLPLKRLKKWSRTVYYSLKLGAIAAVLYLALFAGPGPR